MWSSGVQENLNPKAADISIPHLHYFTQSRTAFCAWFPISFKKIPATVTSLLASERLISPFVNVFQKVFLVDHLPVLYDKTRCTNFSSPMMFIPSNICRTLPSHLAITAWSIPISSAALLHTASQFFQPPLPFVLSSCQLVPLTSHFTLFY